MNTNIFETLAYAFAVAAIFLVIAVVIWLFIAICRWVIFQKAGEAGWKALIPIYETFVLLRIIRRPQWWGVAIILLSILQGVLAQSIASADGNASTTLISLVTNIVSIILLVLSVRITHGLSRSFGRGVGFTIGLLFLPIIFYPILAFGSATYQPQQ